MRALFDLLRGSAAGPATKGVWWRDRLVTAIDGRGCDASTNPRILWTGTASSSTEP